MILAFKTLDGSRIAAQAAAVSTIEECTIERPSVSNHTARTGVKIVMTNGHEYLINEEDFATVFARWRLKLRMPPVETTT